jgi:Mn-dependent DtxR family transcriptional regulator
MNADERREGRRLAVLRELPPLMPQFLRKRRAGLPAAQEAVEQLGVERSVFFTLVQLRTIEGSFGPPVTLPQIRSWSRYIYSTRDLASEPVGVLTEKGLLVEDAAGGYALTPWAHSIVARMHQAAWAHLSRLEPLPPAELKGLTEEFERAAESVAKDPLLAPRPGSHLAGSRSLATFGPDAHLMVRLEQAVYDLWLARDDAHIGAWRDAGLDGPVVQTLTILWLGEASTVSALTEILREDQTPEDVEATLSTLAERGYLSRDGDNLALTPEGALAREDIERETDRRYFASWPHTTPEAAWMRDRFRELVGHL